MALNLIQHLLKEKLGDTVSYLPLRRGAKHESKAGAEYALVNSETLAEIPEVRAQQVGEDMLLSAPGDDDVLTLKRYFAAADNPVYPIPGAGIQVAGAMQPAADFNASGAPQYNRNARFPSDTGSTSGFGFNLDPTSMLGGAGLLGIGTGLGGGSGGGGFSVVVTPSGSGAGSASTDTSGTGSNGVDTTKPTLQISVSDTDLRAGETALVTFRSSELTDDFDLSDVTATGGTLTNFMSSGDGKTFTATFIPASNQAVSASVSVVAGAFTDAAGNGNSAATIGFTVNTVSNTDQTPPAVAISADRNPVLLGQTSKLTFSLSEATTDFDINDILVSTGAVSNFIELTPPGDGSVFQADFTPATGVETPATISIAAGAFLDAAGNGNTAATLSLAVDTAPPRIASVALVPGSLNYSAPNLAFDLRVTFTQPVSISSVDPLDLPYLSVDMDGGWNDRQPVMALLQTADDRNTATTLIFSASFDGVPAGLDTANIGENTIQVWPLSNSAEIKDLSGNSTSQKLPDGALTIYAAAGRFSSETLLLEITDAHGGKLFGDYVSPSVSEGSVYLQALADSESPILVRLTDANAGVVDYLDEFTLQHRSLGSSAGSEGLRAWASPTQLAGGSVTVSVLTELAVRLYESSSDLIKFTPLDWNAAVAQFFGLPDITTTPVVFTTDASFSLNDGVSHSEAYGQALAWLSAADSIMGSIDATLSFLTEHITLSSKGQLMFDAFAKDLLHAAAALTQDSDSLGYANVMALANGVLDDASSCPVEDLVYVVNEAIFLTCGDIPGPKASTLSELPDGQWLKTFVSDDKPFDPDVCQALDAGTYRLAMIDTAGRLVPLDTPALTVASVLAESPSNEGTAIDLAVTDIPDLVIGDALLWRNDPTGGAFTESAAKENTEVVFAPQPNQFPGAGQVEDFYAY